MIRKNIADTVIIGHYIRFDQYLARFRFFCPIEWDDDDICDGLSL